MLERLLTVIELDLPLPRALDVLSKGRVASWLSAGSGGSALWSHPKAS